MRIYDIITKKKRGLPLSREEIDFAINGYMDRSIADYQMSALTMAICLKGMNENETLCLTSAMLHSGETIDLSMFGDLSVDKHSTGGVGDKTTLVVAPIVASLGCKVAKMSGRGLGFTGGTVDKLESLCGYKTSLSPSDFLSQVEKTGVCVIGQSGDLAPADKKLYALRDVTATVDSIPLIASSIMSKKLASGSHSIVLDVKCGNGAFMKERDDAVSLANAMISIGRGFGRNVRALVTNMDVPLGYAIGNSLEVWEAVQVLMGRGETHLTELCVSLASNMVSLALKIDIDDAEERVINAVSSGLALKKMIEWISYQGGDSSLIANPDKLLEAKYKKEYVAKKSGYITRINAEGLGIASMHLGAGRVKKEDKIDFSAGILLCKSFGDLVKEGETIALMQSSSISSFSDCEAILNESIDISDTPPEKPELIYTVL
ncbi:MAG: thymidine phosphorylase [Clostridia bacterium]|nr:thymidine phosphorylase [Clostridia bacterium]